MYRGILALAILLAPISLHAAADGKTPAATVEGTTATAAPGVTLETILQKHSDVEVLANGTSVMRAPSRHVLVARVNRDGSKETGCVVTVEAARDFMRRGPAATSSVPQQEK